MVSREPVRMRAVIKDPQHFPRVVESVQVLNMRQDLMDVCFVCARGQTVYAHKLLLCSVSIHMKKMFLELPDNIDTITIHLPDINARILRFFVDFLYEGELRLAVADYDEFNVLMKMLEVILYQSSSNKMATTLFPETQTHPISQIQQPVQSQPVFYMQPSGLNNQGQMQYMVATQGTLPQGQMMQMPQPAAPGQILQMGQPQVPVAQAQATPQVMQVTATSTPMPQGQMIQMGQPQVPIAQCPAAHPVMQVAAPITSLPQGQMVQMAHAITTQTSFQMVPAGSTAVQQNNMVAPSRAQVSAAQPTQYVMASSDNQMTTSRKRTQTQTQYNQPQVTPQHQIIPRSCNTTQVAQPTTNNTVNNAGGITEMILNTLLENYEETQEGIESLTARQLREKLEPKLNRDLSREEEDLIEREILLFKKNMKGETAPTSNERVESVRVDPERLDLKGRAPKKLAHKRHDRTPAQAMRKVVRRRKKRLDLSDDTDDEDFDPRNHVKRSRRK